MEDLDQSSLVSSSADSPPRPPPAFKYQFVTEPEDEEEEEEEEGSNNNFQVPSAAVETCLLKEASSALQTLTTDLYSKKHGEYTHCCPFGHL